MTILKLPTCNNSKPVKHCSTWGGRVGERILSWQTLLTLCGCDFIQTQTQENKLLAPPGLHILTHTLTLILGTYKQMKR